MRKVITIAREFGAGGGEIGRRVAKELGIQFYDKDIILRTVLQRRMAERGISVPFLLLIRPSYLLLKVRPYQGLR